MTFRAFLDFYKNRSGSERVPIFGEGVSVSIPKIIGADSCKKKKRGKIGGVFQSKLGGVAISDMSLLE